VPLPVNDALYRIAQEAMHNTVNHAQATAIGLCLEESDGLLRRTVSDNGVGCAAGESFPGHLGLVSMRERATGVGGAVDLHSAPGAGTLVTVAVPLHARSVGQLHLT
jgi:signal transduction histidine kinase